MHSFDNNQPYDEDSDYISRKKEKLAAEAAQKLGETLIELPLEKLLVLDLPENLLDAIKEAKRLKSNGAIRRQRQYIGKLMRQIDSQPIEDQLAAWAFSRKAEVSRFHQLEQWRDRLLESDDYLAEFIEKHPDLDIQHVRTLIRNARRQQQKNQPPKSSRELFQYLKTLSG